MTLVNNFAGVVFLCCHSVSNGAVIIARHGDVCHTSASNAQLCPQVGNVCAAV